jgi:PAS domain S-box-containing protein
MRSFAFRAVIITFLTIGLFFASIFFVVIPTLERSIMDQKREMIRELTNSAWNIMAKFHGDEQAGVLPRAEAQKQAVSQILNLHYGQQMKDYFWVNDLHPRMIVHPYRRDLDGKDLTGFTDPDGKKLFVEAVKIVKEHGAGYLNYRWQWKDDATRIVPKLSFVKGFEPWGWLIGTGVYLEDLRRDIDTAERQLLMLSLVILLLATFLLFFLLWDSLLVERKRHLAEQALRHSEEKYRTLVESSGECIVLALGGETLYANQAMLTLLGCSGSDLRGKTLDDLFEATPEEHSTGGVFWRRLLNGEPVPGTYETRLQLPGAEKRNVNVSLSPISLFDKPGVVAVTSDITRQREWSAGKDRLLAEMQATLQFLHQPVANLLTTEPTPVMVAETTTLEQLLETPTKPIGPCLLGDATGKPVGVFSWRHLWQSPGKGQTGQTPAPTAIWQRPLGDLCDREFVKIPATTPVFAAFLAMERRNFSPLLVTAANGAPLAILTESRLAQAQRYSPVLLQGELEHASTPDELARINRKLPEHIAVLSQCGVKTEAINELVTRNTDTVIRQAIRLTIARLGPPPAAFAFLILGSGGRREQTLKTDQDNALIYEDQPPERDATVRAYFHNLSREVCELLARCGYALCDGKIMASNPEWCQPLARWREYFVRWITTSEAQDLLQARIFFDFRLADGDLRLVEALRPTLEQALQEEPRFFFLLARNVLLFQPPLGLFGNFLFDAAVTDRQVFDIKGVMALIVDFARIYALKHGIPQTNTVDRLGALVEAGILNRTSAAEMLRSYEYLMQIRLKSQLEALAAGRAPDNFIDPQTLPAMDQKMLKEILGQIKDFQVKLSWDFTGSMAQAT